MVNLLTARDVASFLGISLSTVYRYMRSGNLASYKIGSRTKVGEKDLEEFLARHKRKTPTVELNIQYELTNLRQSPNDRAKGGFKLAKVRAFTFVQNGELSHGTVYQRKTEKGKRWCINFQVKGKRVRKVIPLAQTEEEARIALQQEIRKSFEREYSIKRTPERAKFNEFEDVYLTNHAKPKKRSWRSDEKYLNAQLVPFFGEMELSEITPLHVRQFIVKRQKDGVRNSTINRELTVLKKMLSLAMEWGYNLTKNPVTKGDFFSEEEFRRDNVLSYEEETRLFHEVAPHLRPIVTCALFTGMRVSEILGLKWEDIDLKKRQIVVKAESSKSRKQRVIPISDTLLFELRKLRRLNAGSSHFVFLYEDQKTGKPRAVKTIRRAFENACRRAGIKDLHFHDLKHTAGTRLIENGADPISVKDILGHAKLETTEIYLHSSLKRMHEAVRLLDNRGGKKKKAMSPECHGFFTKKKVVFPNVLFSVN